MGEGGGEQGGLLGVGGGERLGLEGEGGGYDEREEGGRWLV